MSDVSDVDWLAALIRLYDGNHDKGAGALAEALMPHVAALVAEAEAKALEDAADDIDRITFYSDDEVTAWLRARAAALRPGEGSES